MRGTLRIIKYDAKRDVVLISITSPYSLKVIDGFFDRDLKAHVGNRYERRQQKVGVKLLKWIDNTIEFYISNSDFRTKISDILQRSDE